MEIFIEIVVLSLALYTIGMLVKELIKNIKEVVYMRKRLKKTDELNDTLIQGTLWVSYIEGTITKEQYDSMVEEIYLDTEELI